MNGGEQKDKFVVCSFKKLTSLEQVRHGMILGEASWGGGRRGGLSIWLCLECNRRNDSKKQDAAGNDKERERMLLVGSVGIKGAAISHKNRGVWNWLPSLKMWKLPLQPVG